MDIGLAVLQIVALVLAVTCHEVAHGYVAYRCGDPTAKLAGRITLNPLVHIDPVGSVIFPGILVLFGSPVVFGWAKPVPVNLRMLRDYPRDEILVSIAGVATNLALALVCALLLRGVITAGGVVDLGSMTWLIKPLVTFLYVSIAINTILAVLNILPVPPLDGGHVAMHLLPPRAAQTLARLQPFGILVLILLLYAGVVDKIYNVVIRPILALALGPAA